MRTLVAALLLLAVVSAAPQWALRTVNWPVQYPAAPQLQYPAAPQLQYPIAASPLQYPVPSPLHGLQYPVPSPYQYTAVPSPLVLQSLASPVTSVVPANAVASKSAVPMPEYTDEVKQAREAFFKEWEKAAKLAAEHPDNSQRR